MYSNKLEAFSKVTAQQIRAELAKRSMQAFVGYTYDKYSFNWHHIALCKKLDEFAAGRIKKLMVFMPPQHGKSELVTRRFPAYKLGLHPTTKIAICSYADTLSASFNRDIQRIIDDSAYHEIFPGTLLNASNVSNDAHQAYLRNSSVFEIIDHRGFVKTVGVGGGLTGTPIDLGIIDDPFKDREEASSIRIREKVWSWYTDVFKTRLHNDSQELLVMTRWDEDDLAGRILKKESDWDVIMFQGIKQREVPGDPRAVGEALWPEKHSLERLTAIQNSSPITFNSLYQQEPGAPKELLVIPEWHEVEDIPEDLPLMYGIDFGNPYAVVEVAIKNKNIYLNEVLYARDNPTNGQVKERLHRQGVNLKLRFACDSAEPRSIKDLKAKHEVTIDGKKVELVMNASEAPKGPGSIKSGLKKLKDYKIHVTKSSTNLKNELLNYQFVAFKGMPTDEPIDDYNHLIDATRYALTLVGKASGGGAAAY